MSAPTIAPTKTKTHLDAALDYHALDWTVIPVSADKKPLDFIKWGRWRNQRQTEAEVRALPWHRAYGIALLTWPVSDLVVADFDGPHAEEAWQVKGKPLPDTARTRTRSGGKHLVYHPPAGIEQFTDDNGGKPKRKIRLIEADCDCMKDGHPKPCGVDVLVNGYFIVPPSPGYVEDPDWPLEPTNIVTIPHEVLDLARGTQGSPRKAEVSSEPNWYGEAMRGPVPQGQRNETATRLAGLLLAKGLSADYVTDTLTPWAERTCAPPMDLRELRATVQSVARREATKPTFADEPDPEPSDTVLGRFPEKAWRGIFATYREAMREATHAPEVAIFTGLWAAAAASLARRVHFYLGMEIFPNVALAVYGDTGDGKTTGTRHGVDRLRLLGDHVGVLRGSGSGEAVVDWLRGEKDAHLWYAEEYSEILIRAGWDGATIKSTITTLYDCPETFELKFRRDKDATPLTRPTLNLLVCTTPATFWKYLRDDDIESGFGNRWLYLAGDQRPTIPRPARPDEKLLAVVEEALARLTGLTPTECALAPDAEPLWDEFYRAWEAEKLQPLTRMAAKRVPQYVLKLAMLYAALEGTVPTLTAEQLVAAIMVGKYATDCADRLMRDLKPGGFRNRLEIRVQEILKHDPLPMYKIQRQVGGNVAVEDLDRTIRALDRAGMIEVIGKTPKQLPVWGRVGVDYGK
ncbi:MAG: bifunctional DNA primase/polymerase [candidate division NC10 bacterium]|nr:bifunctional DNA primase/polymerase [candidate division NC10 bacterium]